MVTASNLHKSLDGQWRRCSATNAKGCPLGGAHISADAASYIARTVSAENTGADSRDTLFNRFAEDDRKKLAEYAESSNIQEQVIAAWNSPADSPKIGGFRYSEHTEVREAFAHNPHVSGREMRKLFTLSDAGEFDLRAAIVKHPNLTAEDAGIIASQLENERGSLRGTPDSEELVENVTHQRQMLLSHKELTTADMDNQIRYSMNPKNGDEYTLVSIAENPYLSAQQTAQLTYWAHKQKDQSLSSAANRVATRVAKNPRLPLREQKVLARHSDYVVRRKLASNGGLDDVVQRRLARDKNQGVRRSLALNGSASDRVLMKLALSRDESGFEAQDELIRRSKKNDENFKSLSVWGF